MDWFVSLEIAIKGRVPKRKIESFLEYLKGWSHVAMVSPAGDTFGATLFLSATSWNRALVKAERVFRKALEGAGFDSAAPLLDIHVQESVHLKLELAMSIFPELAGVTEVTEMLGVSRQRLAELRTRDDFPRPFKQLAAGPIWVKPAIENFLKQWRRKPGRPRVAQAG